VPHVGAGADEGASLRAAGLTAICSEPTAVVGCTAQDQGGAKDEVRVRSPPRALGVVVERVCTRPQLDGAT
jgi:hypothetical protein